MCCKKLASDEPSSWKTVLLHYLKPVGGKLILGCSFDVKMLPIKLPPFYEDSLKNFAKCSVATNQCEELTENNELITKRKVRELNLTPLDLFRLVSVVNALPNEWQDLPKRSSHSDKRTFNLQDQIALSLNGQNTPINKAVSKTIYKELRNRVISTLLLKRNTIAVLKMIPLIGAKYIEYHIVSPPIQSCVNFNSNY